MDCAQIKKILITYGRGDGGGYGGGYGRVSGEIWKIDNKTCYIANIDGVTTALYSAKIKDEIAIIQGFIVSDKLEPTFVCLQNGKAAHGVTIKEAMQGLQDKILSDLDFDEIVSSIKSKYKLTDKILARELMSLHRAVTRSCRQGCLSWASERKIDLEKDKFTLQEFIDLTKNSYGSDMIKKLEAAIFVV